MPDSLKRMNNRFESEFPIEESAVLYRRIMNSSPHLISAALAPCEFCGRYLIA